MSATAVLTFRDPEAPPALGFEGCATLEREVPVRDGHPRPTALHFIGMPHPALPWLVCVCVQWVDQSAGDDGEDDTPYIVGPAPTLGDEE